MESAGFNIASFLPFVLIFVLMYFLIIRPQNKKAKEHQALVQSLAKGDKVIMNGGLIGTVVKIISDTELQIELEEGAKARVVRSMVASLVKNTGTEQTKAPAEKKVLSAGKKTAVKKKK